MQPIRESGSLVSCWTRHSWRFAAATLAAAILLTFGGVLQNGFVNWDDDLHVTRNPGLNPLRWSSLSTFWKEPYEDLYVPVSYTLLAGETALADLLFPRAADGAPHPLIFKITSLGMHWGVALLVWTILFRWTGQAGSSLLGALIFALHPVQVESVAWTSEQRGLLAALCGLGAFALHLPPQDTSDSSRRRLWREMGALSLFAAALLAKPTAVAIACLVLVSDLLNCRARPDGTAWRMAILRSVPWFCLAGVMTLLTKLVQSADRLSFQVSAVERLRIALDALAFYTIHCLVPWPLGIDYGRTPAVASAQSLWWLGLLLLPLSLALVLRGSRLVRIAVATFLIGLLPTLGLQPFAFQAISTVADRYAYLALLGPALGAAIIDTRYRKPGRAIFCGLLPVFAVVSAWQVTCWRSDESLFRQALAVNPRSFIAWNNLGRTLDLQGKSSEAQRAFQQASIIAPDAPAALYNLGVQAEREGHDAEAGELFQKAANLPRARPPVLIAWARWLVRHNRPSEALTWYREVLASSPRNLDALVESASLLQASGSTAAAISLLEEAIAAHPEAPSPLVALGHLQLAEGDVDLAEENYLAALNLSEDLPGPLLNLGILRAREKNWAEAEEFLTRARSAAERTSDKTSLASATRELSAVLQTVGLELLAAGDTGAVEKFREACKLEPKSAAAHFHLGRSLLAKGDPEGARQALMTARGLVPANSEPARDIDSLLKSIP